MDFMGFANSELYYSKHIHIQRTAWRMSFVWEYRHENVGAQDRSFPNNLFTQHIPFFASNIDCILLKRNTQIQINIMHVNINLVHFVFKCEISSNFHPSWRIVFQQLR